jgi:hypothetical protein
MPPASAQFLTALGKPAQSSLLLHQMISSNLHSLFARLNREENWSLGPGRNDLQAPPFFVVTAVSPHFNRLFATLYNLIFGKLTNMGHVIPSRNRTLVQIFSEKLPGTDRQLISLEFIAYLKWLIYVAAYEDSSTLAHFSFTRNRSCSIGIQQPTRCEGHYCTRSGMIGIKNICHPRKARARAQHREAPASSSTVNS